MHASGKQRMAMCSQTRHVLCCMDGCQPMDTLRSWGARGPKPSMVTGAASASAAGQAPGHGVVVAVVQGLEALPALAPRQLVRVRRLEEARRQLHQPLGLYRADLRSRARAQPGLSPATAISMPSCARPVAPCHLHAFQAPTHGAVSGIDVTHWLPASSAQNEAQEVSFHL